MSDRWRDDDLVRLAVSEQRVKAAAELEAAVKAARLKVVVRLRKLITGLPIDGFKLEAELDAIERENGETGQ